MNLMEDKIFILPQRAGSEFIAVEDIIGSRIKDPGFTWHTVITTNKTADIKATRDKIMGKYE